MAILTAIVPTYNRAGFLVEALAGLVAQTRPVDEIIVWDDGSTDGTDAAVQSVPGPIRYFRSANGGKSRTLNKALIEARGDLIWICDDDDIAMPHAAETLCGLLERAPMAGVAGGGYRRFRQTAPNMPRDEFGPGYWPDLSQGAPLRHLLEDIFLFQNATLVRRSLYDRAGPFREDLQRSIDYDMIVRLALRAPVVLTEDALFLQRKHDGDRGPAAARHRSVDSEAIWKAADRTVFEAFRTQIPSKLYAAFFDGPTAFRAGLLQRACVYARRTDWAAALQDFEAAARMLPDTPLDPQEHAICRRAVFGKHGIDEALQPGTRARLAQLRAAGPIGRAIAGTVARALLWHGRVAVTSGRLGRAAEIARLLAALGPPCNATTGNSNLIERSMLPSEAYLL